jgi:hypothetical protein
MTNDYIVEHGWENRLHPRYTSHPICNRKMASFRFKAICSVYLVELVSTAESPISKIDPSGRVD